MTYNVFSGTLNPTHFTSLQVLRSPVVAALLHGTPAAGVSQTVAWLATSNGITELSQRAPPIFGWAAITFGIGPHSTLLLVQNFRDFVCVSTQREPTDRFVDLLYVVLGLLRAVFRCDCSSSFHADDVNELDWIPAARPHAQLGRLPLFFRPNP